MKRIIICDSGLGGLNIAAGFCRRDNAGEPCELLYFNAYPEAGTGFNKLPSPRAQEELLQEVLESMKKYSPDMCLIACNTLSIVYERLAKRYIPAFPVHGIIDCAVNGMHRALLENKDSALLVLGTGTTVSSGVYTQRLTERNIAPERLAALACPGLATALESDPQAPEIAGTIGRYAAEAAGLLPMDLPVLHLALCCTHFEFAGELWQQQFQKYFSGRINIVNPNTLLTADASAVSCRYLARIGFFPGALRAMTGFFAGRAPMLAKALDCAQIDEKLFTFNNSIYKETK